MIENIAQIRGLGTSAIAKQKITTDDKTKIAILLGWLESPRKLLKRGLQAEKERAEHLLLNILPKPIAEKLKQGQHTIADSFAEVTVWNLKV